MIKIRTTKRDIGKKEDAPIYTNYDNGTWEDFLKINKEFGCPLTEEELNTLAKFVWENCKNWRGKDMNNYAFEVNGKYVKFSWRGWGGFMSRVRHKFTGKIASRRAYLDFYI